MDQKELCTVSLELVENLIRDWKYGSVLKEKTYIVVICCFLTDINQSPLQNDAKTLHQQNASAIIAFFNTSLQKN